MDVVTANLYGSVDSDISMKVPDGIYIPNTNANHNMYCVKLVKSLWLKTIRKNVVHLIEEIPPK
jgi:hypothetical protein